MTLTLENMPTKQRDRINPRKSSKRLANASLSRLNKKMHSDPQRLMRLAEANARRIAGKPNL